jgi:hypothetical protein
MVTADQMEQQIEVQPRELILAAFQQRHRRQFVAASFRILCQATSALDRGRILTRSARFCEQLLRSDRVPTSQPCLEPRVRFPDVVKLRGPNYRFSDYLREVSRKSLCPSSATQQMRIKANLIRVRRSDAILLKNASSRDRNQPR